MSRIDSTAVNSSGPVTWTDLFYKLNTILLVFVLVFMAALVSTVKHPYLWTVLVASAILAPGMAADQRRTRAWIRLRQELPPASNVENV